MIVNLKVGQQYQTNGDVDTEDGPEWKNKFSKAPKAAANDLEDQEWGNPIKKIKH